MTKLMEVVRKIPKKNLKTKNSHFHIHEGDYF